MGYCIRLYFEPIYKYRSVIDETEKKEIKYVTRLFLRSDANRVPAIKYLFTEIVEPYYQRMCSPKPSMPNVYKAKPAILLDALLTICVEKKYQVKKQIINYQGKVIGLVVKTPHLNTTGFVPCFPSGQVEKYDYEFMMESGIWNTYKDTVEFLAHVYKDSGGAVPCNPIFKVLEEEVVVGILTETNQFVQLSVPEPVSNTADTLREFRNSNYVTGSKKTPMLASENDITAGVGKDDERIQYVERVKLETEFYQAFRNTMRFLLNEPQHFADRRNIEEELAKKYTMYHTRLGVVSNKLKDLATASVAFVKDYDYKVIKDVSLCVAHGDSSKCGENAPLCSVTSGGKCQIMLPKNNLLNGDDNEKLYYTRVADELVRYDRVRQFMLEPQTFLAFGKVDYQVRSNEMVVLQSMLDTEFFDDLVEAKINPYVSHNTYDTAKPRKTQVYNTEITV